MGFTSDPKNGIEVKKCCECEVERELLPELLAVEGYEAVLILPENRKIPSAFLPGNSSWKLLRENPLPLSGDGGEWGATEHSEKNLKSVPTKKWIIYYSVVDPDPTWIRIQQLYGFGSVLWIRVRTQVKIG